MSRHKIIPFTLNNDESLRYTMDEKIITVVISKLNVPWKRSDEGNEKNIKNRINNKANNDNCTNFCLCYKFCHSGGYNT